MTGVLVPYEDENSRKKRKKKKKATMVDDDNNYPLYQYDDETGNITSHSKLSSTCSMVASMLSPCRCEGFRLEGGGGGESGVQYCSTTFREGCNKST